MKRSKCCHAETFDEPRGPICNKCRMLCRTYEDVQTAQATPDPSSPYPGWPYPPCVS